RPVGAARVYGARGAGDEAAVAHDAGADGNHGRVRRVAGRELFRVRQDDLDGPPGLLGQVVGDGRVDRVALATVVAAHEDHVDPNALLGHADRLRQLDAGAEGRLARGPHLDTPVVVDGDHVDVGLQVALVAARDVERVLQDQVRLSE